MVKRACRNYVPHCENCERETEILFDGFKFTGSDAKVIREMDFRTLTRMKVFSENFRTYSAKVCMRCRPASNLEIEEMLSGTRAIKAARS